MKIVMVSDFLHWDIDPFVLGAFFSRTMEYTLNEKKYLYTYTDYKQSKFGNHKKFNFDEYANSEFIDDLNSVSSPKMWLSYSEMKDLDLKLSKKKAYLILENDLEMSIKSFFDKLYFKILNMKFVLDEKFNEGKSDFIRGFIETRGSIDSTAAFISNDYFFNSKFELKKVRILTERMNVPSNVINLNFRELQMQYREGTNKRNTQLRVNIHWYASKIGFVNKYKSYLYSIMYQNNKIICSKNGIMYYSDSLNPPSETINTQFGSYLDLYSDHIYMKKLSSQDINRLRNELKFDTLITNRYTRNSKIIDIINLMTEDICSGCGTTKTSTSKRTGRQNFEIHHFIPLKNNEAVLDSIDNLVKLCPNCHAALKKGRSSFNEQVSLCLKILENDLKSSESLFTFVSSYLETDNLNEIANKVQTLLQ